MQVWAQDLFTRQFPVLGAVVVVVLIALRYNNRRVDAFLKREETQAKKFEENLERLAAEFGKAVDKLEASKRDELARSKQAHDAVVRAKNDEIRRLREDLKNSRGG